MELVWVFLSAVGGTAAALALAWFLFRRFIDIQVARVIENHKTELEQKSALLKTQLSIYAHEQNVGLSRLDEQRSRAIQSIYGLVTRWNELFLEITQPNEPRFPNQEMKLKRYYDLATSLAKVSEDLSTKTRDTAIFFQEQSYDVIARFGCAQMDLSCDFYDATFGKVDISNPNYGEIFPLIDRERVKLRDALQQEVQEFQRLLVHEFRVLMNAERGQLAAGSKGDASKAARP